MMKRFLSLALITCLLFCGSCTTSYMWHKTDPEEYVAIPQDKIAETYLKEHKLKFFKEDQKKVFYVEKNGLQKFKDYTIRTLATPVTLTLDATTTIAVVGIVVFAVFKAPYQPGWYDQGTGKDQRTFEYQKSQYGTRKE